ncbi:MAG TPA: 3-oxoacyl-ACP reductase family protein [bacterium]|nr:3-oxoacyl-ACP reductase family protein [bacterium]
MELRGKTALVTGGAARVGKTTALALAGRGANVAITYLTSEEKAQTTIREIESLGVRGLAVRCDISQPSEVHAMVQEVLSTLGSISILVNNAAIFYKTPFESIREDDWDRFMDTNLKGTFLCCQAVGIEMLKRQEGKIINIGDWSGIRPYKNYIPYCVSKAGVIALTKALAKTLAPHIQVNCVAPGPIIIPTDLSPEEQEEVLRGTPLRRWGSPEDIARTVLFLIEGTDFATGAIIPIDGGRLIS